MGNAAHICLPWRGEEERCACFFWGWARALWAFLVHYSTSTARCPCVHPCLRVRTSRQGHSGRLSASRTTKAGYTIDSLLLAYQGVDWTNRSNWGCNDNEHPSRSGTYFGVTQHPLETVFVKVEWVHDDGTIDKIMPNFVDAYTNFQKLIGARSSAGAMDSDTELSRAVLPSL